MLDFLTGFLLATLILTVGSFATDEVATKLVQHAKHKCESNIPRNQTCKVVITGVVIGEEK